LPSLKRRKWQEINRIKAKKFYSETKQKSLEEIAAAFGDKVVVPTADNFAVEEAIFEDKNKHQQVEVAKV
jgi:hypothetical protein